MLTPFLRFFLGLALIIFSDVLSAAQVKLLKDELTLEQKQTFNRIQDILDDWLGEYEKVAIAQMMLDSFIKSEPDFLPAYIEKARLTIMLGYVGNNNRSAYNREALKIIDYIIKRAPSYAKSYVLAGHVYTNLKDYDNAKRSLEYAEKLGTDDPWLYINWGSLMQIHGLNKKASEYYTQGLLAAGENPKALAAAMDNLIKSSDRNDPDLCNIDASDLIFKNIAEPNKRLRIAQKLIARSYGKRGHLACAREIVIKQKELTPEMGLADLIYAEYLLADSSFRPESMAAAEHILTKLINDKQAQIDAYVLLIRIALSNNDFKLAQKLVANANLISPNNLKILGINARVLFVSGQYADAAKLYEELAKLDPSYENSEMLLDSHSLNRDFEKVNQIYKSRINRDPLNAWTLGNYSSFLLFSMLNADDSITYGERALAITSSPFARNITSLAHLVKAVELERETRHIDARKHVHSAVSIGVDEKFISEKCHNYCAEFKALLSTQPR